MFELGGVRPWRRRDLALLAISAIVAVQACGPQAPVAGGSASPGPGAGGSAGPGGPGAESAFERVLDRIGPNGEVDRQLALDAFVLAFGPLPGVAIPEGPTGRIESGTFALRMLRRFWGTLTPEQQAQADRLIRGSPPAGAVRGGVVAARFNQPPTSVPVAKAVTQAEYQALADKWTEVIAGKLGRAITGDVKVVVNDLQPLDSTWNADAYVDSFDAGGQPQGDLKLCEVHINPSGQTWDGADADGLVAHEVFHCFQDDLSTIAAARNRAAWVTEGSAAWVEQDLSGGNVYGPGRWAAWVGSPTTPLFSRAYDAIGIYGLVAQVGAAPWSVFDEFFDAADSNEGAVAVLRTAGGAAFVDTWGSRYHMDPSKPAWYYDGPGMGAVKVAGRETIPASPGVEWMQTILPWTGMPYDITIDAEVVVIAASAAAGGLARLPLLGELRLAEIDRPLCMLDGGCACPEDSPNAGQLFLDAAAGDGELGVTATSEPVPIQVIASTLAEFCQSTLVDPCLVGTWVSTYIESSAAFIGGGDGMLLTISLDGTFLIDYDLMNHITSIPAVQTDLPAVVEMWFAGTGAGRLTAWDGTYHVLARDVADTTLSFTVFVNGEEEKVMDNEPIAGLAADLGGLQNAPTGMFPADGGGYECTAQQVVWFSESGSTTTNRQQ